MDTDMEGDIFSFLNIILIATHACNLSFIQKKTYLYKIIIYLIIYCSAQLNHLQLMYIVLYNKIIFLALKINFNNR